MTSKLYRKHLLLCALFSWLFLQGCECCGSYDNAIPSGCTALIISNGRVCYYLWETILSSIWTAKIKCKPGFTLDGPESLACRNTWGYYDWLSWVSYNGNSRCKLMHTTTTPKTTQVPSNSQHPNTESMTSQVTLTSTRRMIQTPSDGTDSPKSITIPIVSPEETSGNIAVYITVPIIVIGLLAAGVAVFILYRRRRNASTSSGTSSKESTISTVTNKAYEEDDRDRIQVEGAENNNAEYSEISDAVDQSYDDGEYNTINCNGPNRDGRMIISPNNEENGEYNTINSADRIHSGPNNDGRMNMSPNYNHIVLPSDSDYDHTTNPVRMSREELDTYSHINGTAHNPRHNLINNNDDIYNGLRLNNEGDDKSAVNVQNENPYDHTDSGLRKPANAVDGTYAHVNNGFEENAEAPEYHDYFILEKMEHKSKN